jgi:CDP-glycerol glycerophosphotransferase (TagB/SpsB family)
VNHLRALIKSLYMAVLRMLGNGKASEQFVVTVMTFNDNDAGLTRKLYAQYGERLVVFYGANAAREAHSLAELGVHIEPLSGKNMVLSRAIKYLKHALVIVVDNYVAELAVIPDGIDVYQIWHAAGAIKKFGWDDPATSKRPKADQRRFQEVYNKFTHIVVGSKKMGEIFRRAYRLPAERIMLTGFPRSDEYVHAADGVPIDSAKVLYVPTYRENNADMLSVLRTAFGAFTQMPDKHFIVKLHPTVKLSELPDLPANVQISSDDLTTLMPGAGTLITDYSSAVFEYALMVPEGRTVFFCPDYVVYKNIPGVQDDFLEWGIGTVTYNEEQLLKSLGKRPKDERTTNIAVNSLWNEVNDGDSVSRLFDKITINAG